MILVLAVLLMVLMPLLNGKSPHITVHPEQVELGLTEIQGLDGQVDEVLRTLDVFLGYATFRDELGGTPRRGMLFEGPPGTGKTYLAKAMAKQAGVPFLFISATALQSMWFGMTATRIRSFFKALRKAARKEGGAIGFIEEIDAIGGWRDGLNMSPAPGTLFGGLSRTVSNSISSGTGGMVNELLIQMQSFDQPPRLERLRGRFIAWINTYLPPERRLAAGEARVQQHPADRGHEPRGLARRRAAASRPLRPAPVLRRAHQARPYGPDRLLHVAQGARPRDGRPVGARPSVARHVRLHAGDARAPVRRVAVDRAPRGAQVDAAGRRLRGEAHGGDRHQAAGRVLRRRPRRRRDARGRPRAPSAYFLGKGKRLEVLSIIKRRDSLGLLAHGDEEEHFTRTRSEVESGIAIALGGLVAEELCLGESGTGPASDLAYATGLAAQMVGSFGMAGSLISYEAIAQGAVSQTNLVAKVLGDGDGKQRVEDILEAQRGRVREVLEENRDVHAALRDALIARDELVRDEISDVIEKALANRD